MLTNQFCKICLIQLVIILSLLKNMEASTNNDTQAQSSHPTISSLIPTEQDFIISDYTFTNGQKLDKLNIHYATLGQPIKNKDGIITNAVLILHWTGASGAAMLSDDFKTHLYAAGKPLDANKYFLIFPDSIGHGQSSKPSGGLQSDFPTYGYHDMVHIQHKLIAEGLKISHLQMILGTSMGGMHTWLWTELYPTFMDGAMPIVSLPTKITGRNLLWRQSIISAIQTDPEWQMGKYKEQPHSLSATWPFARMLLDGVPHLEKIADNIPTAKSFIQAAMNEAKKKDANDLIYVLDASKDYDPEPLLESIQTHVYALDFTDDQLDPIELNVLNTLIKRVKKGQAVIQAGTSNSFGHLTMAHPDLWATHVNQFILTLDAAKAHSQ